LQRRSTRAFDPRQPISRDCFYRLLDLCRARPGNAPWDRHQAQPGLQLLLFVHRVDGLPSGLYLLVDDPASVPDLRARTRAELSWDPAPGCPDELPCYRLITANARKAAMHLGCHQQICADSAFALAMLGDVEAAIASHPGGYDNLLREAGRIGQILYIGARAEGIGASGIGCFFDDPIRELIGDEHLPLQPLYMFTVGAAKPELGLIDEPPYAHRLSVSA
jgi:nitroreductase